MQYNLILIIFFNLFDSLKTAKGQIDLDLFYTKNKMSFSINDVKKAEKTNLRKVNNKLFNELSDFLNGNILEAYHYSFFDRYEGIYIFYINDHTTSYFIACKFENDQIQSTLKLTKDQCYLINQSENMEEVLCETIASYILGDYKIKQI
ncbi:hypothetical protein [Aureibacter tunicatorum]|uniref:Uncharacterized protein n=1 Tax=Aureibacter tunicatorum TaxID=866807 RepID=A0AAE3XTS1_9BACT|nr:hypothetical protein [Aureibacter tunicatorum]MDR6241913.1 hypothetical protein [Aureibacter tunicatorum]BDD07462.1 hypothetical protein AUTU_49450 [Aureibacter tunicatorum]